MSVEACVAEVGGVVDVLLAAADGHAGEACNGMLTYYVEMEFIACGAVGERGGAHGERRAIVLARKEL